MHALDDDGGSCAAAAAFAPKKQPPPRIAARFVTASAKEWRCRNILSHADINKRHAEAELRRNTFLDERAGLAKDNWQHIEDVRLNNQRNATLTALRTSILLSERLLKASERANENLRLRKLHAAGCRVSRNNGAASASASASANASQQSLSLNNVGSTHSLLNDSAQASTADMLLDKLRRVTERRASLLQAQLDKLHSLSTYADMVRYKKRLLDEQQAVLDEYNSKHSKHSN